MLQQNNVEPRRLWRRYRTQNSPYEEDEYLLDVECLSCGHRSTRQFPHGYFCDDCLEWTRQSQLDEYWDDIGALD